MRRQPCAVASQVGALSLALAAPAFAEATEEIRLREIESIDTASITPQEALIIQGPPTCDFDGNVLLMPSAGAEDPPRRLLKISSDGKKATSIDLALIPGHEEGMLYGIAPSPDGRLFALTLGPKGQRIVEFKERGQVQVVAAFERDEMFVKRMAAFDVDAFLLEGYFKDEPVIGVFDRNGNLVRRVEVGALAPRAGKQTDREREKARGEPVISADLGHLVAAGDGYVYAVAWTEKKGTLLGVSRAGDVVKNVRLAPPAGVRALASVKASKNRLAVQYAGLDALGRHRLWLSVYDLNSEAKLADYSVPGPGGSLLCYSVSDVSGDVFTMLGMSPEGHLRFVRIAR